jgi:GLPGLI family protein
MKNYLIHFIFCLVFVNLISGQNYSGSVTYGVKTFSTPEDSLAPNSEYSRFIRNMRSAANELSFELVFDQNKAVFELVKFLPLDKNNSYIVSAIQILGGDKTFYSSLMDQKLFEEKNFLGKDFLVETPFDELGWELLNESKVIDGYTCFKAVRNRMATGRDFKKTKVPVYAWYCPEIALNTGPFEAVGLPGLVLEFRLPNYSFVARNIMLNQKVILKVMPKGETISSLDYENIVLNRAKKGLTLD